MGYHLQVGQKHRRGNNFPYSEAEWKTIGKKLGRWGITWSINGHVGGQGEGRTKKKQTCEIKRVARFVVRFSESDSIAYNFRGMKATKVQQWNLVFLSCSVLIFVLNKANKIKPFKILSENFE